MSTRLVILSSCAALLVLGSAAAVVLWLRWRTPWVAITNDGPRPVDVTCRFQGLAGHEDFPIEVKALAPQATVRFHAPHGWLGDLIDWTALDTADGVGRGGGRPAVTGPGTARPFATGLDLRIDPGYVLSLREVRWP